MCGIAGELANNTSLKLFEESLDKINSRGPNATGIFTKNEYIFGHKRLSILDLDDRSNQPMSYKNLTITYNGEIYNYKELKNKYLNEYEFETNGDTEVLLKLWHRFGTDSLKYLRGMWSFSIYDSNQDNLYLVRDYFGIKPLFYNDKIFSWASDVNFWNSKELTPNIININTFILSGKTEYDNSTFFLELKKVPPASILIRNSNGCISIESYLNFIYSDKNNLKNSITQSIKAHLVSDVNVGAALSGGIDSSSIVSQSFNSLKMVFTAGSTEKNSDQYYAEKLSKEFSLKQVQINLDNLDLNEYLNYTVIAQGEPFDGFSVVLQNILYSEVKNNNIKVNLSGQGADELFLGYKKYLLLYLKKNKYNLKSIITIFKNNSDVKIIDFLSAILIKPWMISVWSKIFVFRFLKNSNFYDYYKELFSSLNKGIKSIQYFEIFGSNLQSLLRYEDRNSMFYSIESRVPFVDREIFNNIIDHPKLGEAGRFKNLLINNSGVPKFISERRSKLGFHANISKYLETNRKSIKQEVINSSFVKQYVKSNMISKLINKDKFLIRLYILKLWGERFQ
jgi:asparagine synthase (glutamine-hydrolysing)